MTRVCDHIEKVKELDLPSSEFILVGGSILAIHGIRESNDVDVVVSARAFRELKGRGWEIDTVFKERWGRERLVHDVFEIYKDVYIQRTEEVFSFKVMLEHTEIIRHVQCQTLAHLVFIKLDNNREKDRRDTLLIAEYLKEREIIES